MAKNDYPVKMVHDKVKGSTVAHSKGSEEVLKKRGWKRAPKKSTGGSSS